MTGKTGYHIILGALFVIGAVTALYFQFSYHKFLNVDTLSYINIAELYAQGEWSHAINGYWSPLYSWILALCKLAGIPLLPACYIINVIAAACCLYLVLRIAMRFLPVQPFYYLFGLYALSLLLYYSMSTLTPDLIGTVFCLWFLLLITDERFASAKRMAYTAGVIGAFMYFAKSYNFAMLNLFLCGYVVYLLVKKSSRIKPLLKTYGIFLFLSLVWITILSVHEKKITFATSGRFNHNLVNPRYEGPFPTLQGLYAPPFDKAYFAHIDPSHMMDGYDWSPFEKSRNFRHQLDLIGDSVLYYYNLLDGSHIKSVLIFVILLLLVWNRKKRVIVKQPGIALLLSFFLLYPVLYFPIVVLDRYVFICFLLFNFLFFYLACIVSKLLPRKTVIAAILAATVISIAPLVISGKKKLQISSIEYRYYNAFHAQLPGMAFLKDQRIASDEQTALQSVQLCYHYNCRYYFVWKDEQYSSLKKYNIRYFLSEKEQAPFPFLLLKEKMPVDNTTLFIYEVK